MSPRSELFATQGGRVEKALYIFPAVYSFTIYYVLSWIAFLFLWSDEKRTLAIVFIVWIGITAAIIAMVAVNRGSAEQRYRQVMVTFNLRHGTGMI